MPLDDASTTLENALMKAFSLDSLKRMTRHRLGVILEHELDLHKGLKYIVSDLVELSVREGWRDDLLRAAAIDNPGNPFLALAAKAIAIPLEPPHAPLPSAARLDQIALEKLVRERGMFLKWQDYLRKMSALGHHLCRIEVPKGTACGTGWLVAPDLVLTNYHVIEDLHCNKAAIADIACRFEYFIDQPDGATLGGVTCGLAEKWLVDWSPYAPADKRADAVEPTPDELDYALIRLERAIGNDRIERLEGKRGCVILNATPPVVLAEDLLLVPQFPDGRSLELSFGKALEYNGTATRLRHDANTESGASGSPCLTVSLEPFGLHHASGPGRALRYNQSVPLRLIIQRMQRQKIDPFWQA